MAVTFSKKQLVMICFIMAMLFHLGYYINLYGPSVSLLKGFYIYWIAVVSFAILLFIYLTTYWRANASNRLSRVLYDLLMIWIIICFLRTILQFRSLSDIKLFMFSTYLGLSFVPVLFYIAGISISYFFSINRLLSIYLIAVTPIAVLFSNFFELQLFLLYPIFFAILTIPFRTNLGKIFIILLSISIVLVSMTNRAGILRILISYSILGAFYLMTMVRIDRRLIKFLVFCILMIPVVSLVLAYQGVNVFQLVLGLDNMDYSQLNPHADTRTFLYFEVFQDLADNKAFLFGKGVGAGYSSIAFNTYSRNIVEVGFLQILLKIGIVGFILYSAVIVSSIYQALGKSNSYFVKTLGLLLASYLLMLFIENVLAFNLLNVMIWITAGMCQSSKLRELSDNEIIALFRGSYVNGNSNSINSVW